MVLTDLVKTFVRGSALAAALYGCGGSDSKRLCQSDYDCQAPSTCGSEGYCVVPGGGGGNEGNFCQDAANQCNDYLSKNDVHQCQQTCDQFASPRYQPTVDCAWLSCVVETSICDTSEELEVRIITCLESYGWRCSGKGDEHGCVSPNPQ